MPSQTRPAAHPVMRTTAADDKRAPKPRAPKSAGVAGVARKARAKPGTKATDPLNTEALEGLLGYCARRVALTVIEQFLKEMKVYQLRPVEFSILSVIMHNPGVTARQLCATLGLLPPNLVAPLDTFAQRGLIERRAHPQDGRAWGLHGTSAGQNLMRRAQATAQKLEREAASGLSTTELNTLLELLKKVYK